jgi:probable rRNA maturation factor
VLDVEVFGEDLAPDAPPAEEVRALCELAAESRGVRDGHVAVEYVPASRIAALNERHRGKAGPTDVLSFPIDGVGDAAFGAEGSGGAPRRGPSELGDIVICPQHTADLREAIVHGMLHLLGMDHETDAGEMLALQAELLRRASRPGR